MSDSERGEGIAREETKEGGQGKEEESDKREAVQGAWMTKGVRGFR